MQNIASFHISFSLKNYRIIIPFQVLFFDITHFCETDLTDLKNSKNVSGIMYFLLFY